MTLPSLSVRITSTSYFGHAAKRAGWSQVPHQRPNSVFQRLVLDQGFYPDGIYTARRAYEALENDIKLLPGRRLQRRHDCMRRFSKPRFLYHCRPAWATSPGAKCPNWGLDSSYARFRLTAFCRSGRRRSRRISTTRPLSAGAPTTRPGILTAGKQSDDCTRHRLPEQRKQLDPTRPCIDTSGNFHVATDIF